MIAIVDYFHGPHRLASEELASSRLTGKEIPRGLIESHPTNGTGYVSNTLWTNSIPIHHPEENEFFAALRAAGDKLVHRALSHTDSVPATAWDVRVFLTMATTTPRIS
jgi:hypothetical protein